MAEEAYDGPIQQGFPEVRQRGDAQEKERYIEKRERKTGEK